MTERPPFKMGDYLLAVLVLLLALGVRFAYLSQFGNSAQHSGGIHLQSSTEEVSTLSYNLAANNQFSSVAPLAASEEATAHASPGYPYFVSLVRRFSPYEHESWTRWAQCGLGALTVLLYFLFAWRAFQSRTVAIFTGLFTALYPFWVVTTGQISDSVLASFLLALSLFLTLRGVQTGGPMTSLLAGLSLAALALVRASLLPFALITIIWFLWRCRTVERGWLCALLAFLGFINGLVPWTIRNFQQFQTPMPIVDSAYLHVWMGNNSLSDGGMQSQAEMEQALQHQGINLQDLQAMPQPQRYRQLAKATVNFIRTYPEAFVANRFKSTMAFLLGANQRQQERIVGEATAGPDWWRRHAQTILTASLLVMFLLAFLGWRWSYGWQKGMRPLTLALVWIPLPYIFTHASDLHGARLPLDGVLLTLAAFALSCFWPGVGAGLLQGEGVEREEEV